MWHKFYAMFSFPNLLSHYILSNKHQISFFKILLCNKNVIKSPNTFRLVSTFSKITLDVQPQVGILKQHTYQAIGLERKITLWYVLFVLIYSQNITFSHALLTGDRTGKELYCSKINEWLSFSKHLPQRQSQLEQFPFLFRGTCHSVPENSTLQNSNTLKKKKKKTYDKAETTHQNTKEQSAYLPLP